MHYVTIPEPVEVERAQPIELVENGKKTPSLTFMLSLPQFLHDLVFTRKGWRDPKQPNRIELLISLAEKFPLTLDPGDVVAVADAEHEALCEECTLRDVQLAPTPAIAFARLQRAILMASTTAPPKRASAEPTTTKKQPRKNALPPRTNAKSVPTPIESSEDAKATPAN